MISKEKRTCENCSHRNVCIMKDDLIKCKREIKKIKERIDFIDIIISCKEFREDIALRTPFGK